MFDINIKVNVYNINYMYFLNLDFVWICKIVCVFVYGDIMYIVYLI